MGRRFSRVAQGPAWAQVSMAPFRLFKGFTTEGGISVRKGDFKLIWLPIPFGNDDWQLYDLSKDPAELNDLSQERPKLRKELINIWKQYSTDVGVVLPPGGALRMDMSLPSTQ